MKIYEIQKEILECIDSDGEIIDIDKFEALQLEWEVKIDNLACWYKQLMAGAEAIGKEIDILKARQQVEENAAEKVKKYLSDVMQGQKLETPRNKIGWHKSKSVNIFDESAIDERFIKITVTRAFDKKAIRKAIKMGEAVKGAEIIVHDSIQIK